MRRTDLIVTVLLGSLGTFAVPGAAAGQDAREPAPAGDSLDSRPEPASPAVPREAPERMLHTLVNMHRERVGCRPLAWHASTAAVAEARSVDMRGRGYFDHVTPDGRTVFDEVSDAGIEAWGSIAENIALTPAGPSSVLELWRDSPSHRRNLDNCSFTHHGLGQRTGVWTQILLAQPKAVGSAP